MTRPPRWWESGEQSVEGEAARFAEAGLAFTLDQGLFTANGTVVFRGDLRYGDDRCPAAVIYPPAYLAGEHPEVYAPSLPIVSPHKREGDGLLCLDHRSFGTRAPMSGPEAVLRAEALWRLTTESPAELEAQSVDLPTVRAEAFSYETESSVFALEAGTRECREGWLSLRVEEVAPFRGSVETLGCGLDVPPGSGLDLQRAPEIFGGDQLIMGFWRRIPAPPEVASAEGVRGWVEANHPDLLARTLPWAGRWRSGGFGRRPGPALLAFVYEDEGPRLGETYDAWLFVLLDPDGSTRLPRPFPISQRDRWTRQPHLQRLGDKRVGVVGAGALGSQTAIQLGRAGIGEFFIVEYDLITPGIVVRHAATLPDAGLLKASHLRKELGRINPFAMVASSGWGYGRASGSANPVMAQELDDAVSDALSLTNLIIDATAETAVGFHLATLAAVNAIPLLSLAVSPGGWGARILLQRPGRSGCLECLARSQQEPTDTSPEIPDWAEDPDAEEVFERGCAQPTFTAPGFELTSAASAAARCAVQLLLDGDGYPAADFDLVTLRFRNTTTAGPEAEYTRLPQHPACTSCRV
ncbi:MAG: hypothetical protein QOI10_3466 [Solirubrobacterales bacterium]|jgi:molybdopterin/thiamine biosynthesis adenylyltransferase|nr:hypothetical protein [Solirubrobacterales bacterium]